MVVTIQEALQAVDGAIPDDLAVILDLLGTDGYTGDKPAGSFFLLLKPEDYKGTLNTYQRNLTCAAQRKQGGVAGVPLRCMLWQMCIWVCLVLGARQGACCSCCCKEQVGL